LLPATREGNQQAVEGAAYKISFAMSLLLSSKLIDKRDHS
jgi:hypothetical protein